jgi:hypothetical protein
MTNFPERDTRRYDYMDSGNAPMWIIGLVAVVVLILGMLWVGSNVPVRDNTTPDQAAIRHMIQPPAPTTSPAVPSPTPKP